MSSIRAGRQRRRTPPNRSGEEGGSTLRRCGAPASVAGNLVSHGVLNLANGQTSGASGLMSGFGGPPGGLRRASESVLVKQFWQPAKLIIETPAKRWEFNLPELGREPQAVSAQILNGWSPHSIPSECK